jgi:putative transposase
MNPHFTALEAAYQLRYYLSFKTKHLKPTLAATQTQDLAHQVLADVCDRNSYHLLETNINQDHLRLLISLQPLHTVSKTVRMLKGNLQYRFGKSGFEAKLAEGYFARSAGTIDMECVRKYVDDQVSHHGYVGEWTESLIFRNQNFASPAFAFAHHVSILDYHLVLATQNRLALFDEGIAPNLFRYLLAVSKKHQFAIDRIGVLPDHVHLIFEGIPSVSVADYTLAIMNNTRYWMTQKYSGVLKETSGWDVWRPSFYAGTVGEFTTAQLASFLRQG